MAASLTISGSSSNTALVPNASIVFGGSGASRTLTVTPAANQFGTSTIMVTVSDGTATASDSFVLTVNSVNDEPTITDIADTTTDEDTATSAIAFTIGDVETVAASLTISGSSSNTALVPNTNIVFGGSGGSRTLTITPAANQFGTSTIMVTTSDGAASTSDTFVLTVNAVNDAPTISDIVNTAINEDTTTSAIAVTIGDGDGETVAASLTISGSSSNTALVPNASIVFGGSGASRTLTVTPAANQFGTSTIMVTVSDGTATTSDSFVLTVNSVNDEPAISELVDRSILFNSTTEAIAFSIGDLETAASSLTVSGTSSNQVLVPNANMVFGGSGASRTVAIMPAANQSGTATLTITVSDGELTGSDTFILMVTAPEISVEQVVNVTIPDGGFFDFGNVGISSVVVTKNFTIKNTGTAALNLTGTPLVSLSGSSSFTLQVQPSTPLLVGGSTTFGVVFDPASTGLHRATVNIANDDLDEGPFSFTLEGTGVPTLTQTITFIPPTTVYLSQSPLTLTAEANSGLPVALRVVLGPASLSGGVLTLSGAGNVIVEATQVGGGSYKAATPVVKTVIVKADPTVLTLVNLSQRYDGTPKFISALGEGSAIITYKAGTTYVTTPPTAAGSYAVSAVAGAVTKTGTLIIAKAHLYVTPDNKRKFAGQPNPALTYTITGYQGGDTAAVITKAPVPATTTTLASVGGVYPITASAATALNYSFIYLQGTMVVESFAGNYEALLVDSDSKPVGKLSITVAATSKTFTAKLATATETSAVSFSGPLLTVGEEATSTATTLVGTGKVPYRIEFTLPIVGDVNASAARSSQPLGIATDGQKISTKTIAYTGTHTAVLEPAASTGGTVPEGAGWATASISTTGVMTLAGKLGDGTGFTSALSPDVESNPGYRLFVQPYLVARTQSFLAGSFTLAEHPMLTGRRYLAQSSLTWKKTGLPADVSYRTSFGPVNTVMMIDPWLAPKTTAPAITLAQRLGLTGTSISFGVSHSDTNSASQINLPTRLALSTANAVSVLTAAANPTKWKTLTFMPTTGTFTGSFELMDAIKRPVTFSGILRQPATNPDTLIGEGHYLLPPLTGTEKTTGEVMLTRP